MIWVKRFSYTTWTKCKSCKPTVPIIRARVYVYTLYTSSQSKIRCVKYEHGINTQVFVDEREFDRIYDSQE